MRIGGSLGPLPVKARQPQVWPKVDRQTYTFFRSFMSIQSLGAAGPSISSASPKRFQLTSFPDVPRQ
jgi:hypothetical protein